MEKNSNSPVRVDTVAGSRPGVVILKPQGFLDITNYGEFEELTRTNEALVLLVDLTEVPYIDSAVLGSMVAMHVSCARHQRKCALVHANQRIQNMLAVSGVGEILVSFTNLAQAEAALSR